MHTFLGGGRILCEWDCHGDNFLWRANFPGDEIFRRNFTLGEFAQILIRNSFLSHYRIILRVEMIVSKIRIIVRSKFSQGLNYLENKSVERSDLSFEM